MSATIETVQWKAKDYAEHSQGQYGWGWSNVKRPALRGTEWVLDIGCGDGRVTADLARRVPAGWALGVDNSPDMADFTRRSHTAGPANISFIQADAELLDLPSEFDIAFRIRPSIGYPITPRYL